jgi:hypothetical protein
MHHRGTENTEKQVKQNQLSGTTVCFVFTISVFSVFSVSLW